MVPAVPVRRSVPAKIKKKKPVPAVLVSGSGSVPGPPWLIREALANTLYIYREGWAPEPLRVSLKALFVAKDPFCVLEGCLDTVRLPLRKSLQFTLQPTFKLPCDRKFLHYSNFFPGINFGIALHYLYRKYFSDEILLLYITLSCFTLQYLDRNP